MRRLNKVVYQPLYGKIADNAGGYAHSLVLRGRVDNINYWLNSWFGSVLNVSARLIDGRKVVSRPDLRRIKKDKRKDALKQYEQDVAHHNKVIVDIDLEAKKEFVVNINGIELSYDRLKFIHDLKLKRMDMQLEALKRMKKQEKNTLEMVKSVIQ